MNGEREDVHGERRVYREIDSMYALIFVVGNTTKPGGACIVSAGRHTASGVRETRGGSPCAARWRAERTFAVFQHGICDAVYREQRHTR